MLGAESDDHVDHDIRGRGRLDHATQAGQISALP